MYKTYWHHNKLYSYDYLINEQPNPTDYFSHMHNDYEILFFMDGDADYTIEGKTYHLNKNDMLIIKPAKYHSLRLLTSQSYERCVFYFQERTLNNDQIEIIKNANIIYHLEKKSVIRNFFDNLKQCEPVYTKSEFEYLKESSLYNIINALKYLPHTEIPEETSSSLTLNRIIRYIQDNPCLPISVDILSEKFFVSSSWISHNFKTHFKMGVKQYINQKRILYAQNLVLQGENITKVAEMCGYTNYTTFYRQYKNFLGVEPLEDRLSANKNPSTKLGNNINYY